MRSILFLTRRCNLLCDYCYQQREIPALLENQAIPSLDMPPEVIFQSIHWTLEHSRLEGEAGFGFFGGEPLLVRKSLVYAVNSAERMAEERGLKVGFSTSTNGTLLTEADARFFAHHRFLVQLSLDGTPSAHDRHRRYPDGRPSAGLVVQALHRLNQAGAFVEVASVITPDNMAFLPESFRFLTRSLGVRSLDLSLAVNVVWTQEQLAQLEQVMTEVSNELLQLYRDDVDVTVDLFDEPIESHVRGYYPHQFCPFGLGKVAIDIDGRLFPCDRIAADGSRSSVVIGHLETGIDQERMEDQRYRIGLEKPPCPTCEVQGRCRHWCGCVNMDSTGDPAQVSETFCHLQRLRIRVADSLAETLYEERNPLFISRFYDE